MTTVPPPASNSSSERRKILSGLTKLLVVIGLGFLSIPFLFSMFSATGNSENMNWIVTAHLDELEPAKVVRKKWSGGDIWIYTRTDKENDYFEINWPGESKGYPFLVIIPYENKKNCQLSLSRRFPAVFTEPCYGAKYDVSGKKIIETGHPEQTGLVVLNYVVENGELKIPYNPDQLRRTN